MQKIISCRVTDEYVQGTGAVVGAAGSHDDAALELSFSEIWNGTTKRIVWFDALGQNPTLTILTPQLLVPGEAEVYRVPIPAEAKAVAGNLMMSIRGVVIGDDGYEDKAVVSATAEFVVLESVWDNDASESEEITPSQAEQLQAEVDSIKMDISATIEAVKTLDEYVETTGKNADAAELAEQNAKNAQSAAAASATAASNSASQASTNAANAARSAAEAKQAATDANGVLTFNGRKGSVVPQKGDYSVEMVTGAVPETRKINGKPLTSDITLTAEEMAGAVPITRKINGKALSSDITLSAADVGAASDRFGLGAVEAPLAPSGDNGNYDANLIQGSGFYRAHTNVPTNNWYRVLHIQQNDTYWTQIAFNQTSGEAFIRTNVNGTIGSWVSIATAETAAPAGYGLGTDVGARAPLNGDGKNDANLIVGSGFYIAEINTPVGGWSGILHIQLDRSKSLQIGYYRYYAVGLWYRHNTDGTWGEWEQFATTDYAIGKTGDHTVSGSLIFDENGRLQFYKTGSTRYAWMHDGWNLVLIDQGNNELLKISSGYGNDLLKINGNVALHTGNKRSGSYTGTGEARTINIGGVGTACMVMAEGGWSFAVVSQDGAFVFAGGRSPSTFAKGKDVYCFENGDLKLNDDDSTHWLNNSAKTYYYWVL